MDSVTFRPLSTSRQALSFTFHLTFFILHITLCTEGDEPSPLNRLPSPHASSTVPRFPFAFFPFAFAPARTTESQVPAVRSGGQGTPLSSVRGMPLSFVRGMLLL